MSRRRLNRVSISLVLILALSLTACTARTRAPARMPEEAIVATLHVGDYPHGIAIDRETGRAYVANMGDGTLSVVEGSTCQVVGTVEVGKSPRGVAIDTQADRLYVADLGLYDMVSHRLKIGWRVYRPIFAVTVVDLWTYDLVAHIPVGTNPWLVAVNETSGRIYAANYASHSVSVIDGATNQVVTTVGVGRFGTPYGIAVNERTNRVYITSSRQRGPLALGGGRLVVVDGQTHRVLRSLRVGARAQVAVNEQTNRLYVTDRGKDTLTVIDGGAQVIATVDVGRDPFGVEVNETTNRVYVANQGGDSVSVIDGALNRVLYSVGVGRGPTFVAVDEARGRVYVANTGDDTVSVLAPSQAGMSPGAPRVGG